MSGQLSVIHSAASAHFSVDAMIYTAIISKLNAWRKI